MRHRLAHFEKAEHAPLILGEPHGGADKVAVVCGKKAVHEFRPGELHNLRRELRGELLDRQEALPVSAHLGEEMNEGLDSLVRHVPLVDRPLGRAAQEPVCLLDDQQVAQGAHRLRERSDLEEAHQEEPHDERLLLIRAELGEVDDRRPIEELGVGEARRRVEAEALRAPAEAAEPGEKGAPQVPGELAVVAGVLDDALDRGEEVGEGGKTELVAGERVGSAHEIPAASLVGVVESLLEKVRGRRHEAERGRQSGADQVEMGVKGKPGGEGERIEVQRLEPDPRGRGDAKDPESRHRAPQFGVFALRRLKDEERNAPLHEAREELVHGRGLAGSGMPRDQRVAREGVGGMPNCRPLGRWRSRISPRKRSSGRRG